MKKIFIVLFAMLLATFSVAAQEMICEPSDVILVIDTSKSMITNEPTPGVTRLEAAKESAKYFIDQLAADDFSGLVSFATTSPISGNINVGLTDDINVVKAGIDSLVGGTGTEQWTCIACGIDAAQAELDTNGRSGVNQVIVLLSDGKPSMTKAGPVPTTQAELDASTILATQEAKDSSDASKAKGTLMFTIGIGSFDQDLMEYMAQNPYSPWFSSGTEDDLEDIYDLIAQQICTPLPYCGNGELDPGEQCDDGNNIDGDGCSSTCQLESDEIPEFTTIGAALFLAGAGFYMYRKRK